MLGCVHPHVRPVSTSSAIRLFISLAYLALPFGFLSHIYTDLLETLYILDTIIWLYVLQIHFFKHSRGLSPPQNQ